MELGRGVHTGTNSSNGLFQLPSFSYILMFSVALQKVVVREHSVSEYEPLTSVVIYLLQEDVRKRDSPK